MNPLLGVLVAECETTSARVHAKLSNGYTWCFCDLCGKLTEYAVALEARKIFKKMSVRNDKPVPITEAMLAAAQRAADALVVRFEKALAGEYGPYEAARMVATCCNIRDMRGELLDVETFRDQVERKALTAAWALQGDVLGATLLPGQKEGEPKPSKFYCEDHNPSRSVEARRAYQRDRRLIAEYEDLMAMIWSQNASRLAAWNIEAHAYVRTEAYRLLHAMKSTKGIIAAELSRGVTNQSEIARKLGVSRQTISIAIKRHGLNAS